VQNFREEFGDEQRNGYGGPATRKKKGGKNLQAETHLVDMFQQGAK